MSTLLLSDKLEEEIAGSECIGISAMLLGAADIVIIAEGIELVILYVIIGIIIRSPGIRIRIIYSPRASQHTLRLFQRIDIFPFVIKEITAGVEHKLQIELEIVSDKCIGSDKFLKGREDLLNGRSISDHVVCDPVNS